MLRLPLILTSITFGLPAEGKVDFAQEINPLFVKHCTACHGGVKEAGGLSFIYREKALIAGESGEMAIVPGKPEESELMRRITLPADDDEIMPQAKHGPPLEAHEIDLFRQWISEGAEWSGHWSMTPVEVTEPPQVESDWAHTTIDKHILATLEARGLTPSEPASRPEWLRRVTLDLTGLLPTMQELGNYLADESPDADAKVVDRLLASPAYSERWASLWLDLARYADSEGLGVDNRRDIYPYRNWVIEAFDKDMPFDEFTIKQLAGDLLPERSLDDLVATGFNRLTTQNSEGGTDDEEFRVMAVMDRAATTYNTWQGLTMECVQCHSHPYDPIQHEEYFQTLALFNNTRDADRNANEVSIRVPNEEKEKEKVLQTFDALQKAEQDYLTLTKEMDNESTWYPPVDSHFTTRGSSLVAETRTTEEGTPDFFATGTPGGGARHTVEFSLGNGPQNPLTVLKLTVLPEDIETARHMAEAGFSLKNVQLSRLKGDGSAEIIPFQHVSTSVAHNQGYVRGLMDPSKGNGWSVTTKMFHPHWAALILKEPLTNYQPDDRFRLELVHSGAKGNESSVPMVVRRFQFAFSDLPDWIEQGASPARIDAFRNIQNLQNSLAKVKGPRTLIMHDVEPGLEREMRLFIRGNWMTRGEVIKPGTPDHLPPIESEEPDRLDFAKWLASSENPLTARVWVNRLWHQLFGLGLVETLEDFGAAGMPPSHPALLDYLAHQFTEEHQWSTKEMLREIALSATYRQTAEVSAEKREQDAHNIYLSYGPRQRMTAEMVRDTALQAAGLLSEKRLGGITFPPIPGGVWKPFQSGDKWNTAARGSDDRYRRMIYTYMKREIPFPGMATFDAPSREFCKQRRMVSNTPLQALMTMNDEAFFEAAQAFAKRVFQKEGQLPEQISQAYQLATTEIPDEETISKLMEAYETFLKNYQSEPQLAADINATPEEAARTLLCSVILNLDETLTR
ncbi:PSD1 and planctomycete cytochrome C domain-containing protein [Roseibacillus persicicus]|uniref:PSD1 and planctomycete cytochrome C domain-containing protein n=1 Tax=Roseibacillus persicicus TaxID=454148 RepID=UPI00280CFB88|nr:PSD1 and planctomycete cytochrome C domain-containing protein [Roseibacillus persicicus]MDQ8190367.1 PSD1 and planctomycete cytochrome C domain-containing protein [Roseibacillus persicicus]